MYLHTLPLTQTDVSLKVLTHLKPPRRFCMLFFDVLPFTDDASVVNSKTSKKSMQKRRGGFGVSRPLTFSVYKAILPRCVCWLFQFGGGNGSC